MSYLVNDDKATTVVNSLRSNIHYLVNGYTVDPRVDTIDDLYHRILHLINSHYEMMIQTNPQWYCCRQSREKEMILRCCIETFVMEEIYPMVGVSCSFNIRCILYCKKRQHAKMPSFRNTSHSFKYVMFLNSQK